MIANHNI